MLANEFESFIPWLFTSLDYQHKDDLDEILSILARASDSNLKKKDIIIQRQNEIRLKNNINDDMEKMDFLFNKNAY